MTAKIYHLSPKGSAWLVYHRLWKDGGCTTFWAFVFDYESGITAYEAWQKTSLRGNPPYFECICIQLDEFPMQGDPNDNIKRAIQKSGDVAALTRPDGPARKRKGKKK